MAKTQSVLLLMVLTTTTVMAAPSGTTTRKLMSLVQPQPNLLTYHNGAVLGLGGDIPVSILWYGRFTPAQKAVVSDFLLSLSSAPSEAPAPSVSQWWITINQLYLAKAAAVSKNGAHGQPGAPPRNARVVLAGQVSDEGCSLGKRLTLSQLPALAARARPASGGVALVLTGEDVVVESFCMSRCGLHASDARARAAYAWVGNPATQCPGQCAWPFHQPPYGPHAPPLVPPSGDAATDGVVINVASVLAGAVTNPFGDGFYQGDRAAPLEAASACAGVYGKGAYPGYAGQLLVDKTTGASYNADGARGRKYLLPALFDPDTSTCSTLV